MAATLNNTNNIETNNGLAVISWNVRGMKADNSHTINELQHYLNNSNNQIDVICLQETHYTEKDKTFKLRVCSKGGGVCIYVRLGLPFTENIITHKSDIEVCSVQIYGHNTLIVGDFNLKHICWNPAGDFRYDGEADDLLTVINDNNINFLNDGQITRVSEKQNETDSAIDLSLISSHLHSSSELYVINNTFGSDHLPLLTSIKYSTNKTTNFNHFYEKLTKFLDKTLPKSKSKNKKSKKKIVPWWNSTYDNVIRIREKSRKIYKKDPTSIKHENWQLARLKAKEIIQNAKKQGWQNFCSKITHKTNSKELWDFVRKVKGTPLPNEPPFKIGDK
ncbi:hypothetical protein MAR_029099, partial [Mya arenaria]